MITLSELRGIVDYAPRSQIESPPGWKQLSDSGSKIIASAVLGTDSYLAVYKNGYVLYQTGQHHTTFSLQDTCGGYTYDMQVESMKKDLHLCTVR